MQYKIHGTITQTLDFLLSQGETLLTESTGIAWMRGDVRVEMAAQSNPPKGLGKKTSPEAVSKVTYTCYSPKCLVVLSPELPANVVDVTLTDQQGLICQKPAFLCAHGNVEIVPFYQQKLSPAFGEGFILYQVFGPGTAFLQAHGEVREYELRQGEVIRVDPGHVIGFEPTVNFGIIEEDLILAVLSGPGRVWFQTISSPNFATQLARYKPAK
jgi:uncharacterized protein (AIM24 family)